MAKGLALRFFLMCLLTCVALSPALEQAWAHAMFSGRKILWVDSYESTYSWSEGLERGIASVLDGTGVELRVVHMDTKRLRDEEAKRRAGLEALEQLRTFGPDVVIASDDNAQKYLVVPHLMDSDIPIVFCGVNWDASPYGYPTRNVTGMVEVEQPLKVVEHMSRFSDGDRIGFLSDDSLTSRRVLDAYQNIFFKGALDASLVPTFEDFKREYLRLQDANDMVILYNHAAVQGWDEQRALEFILRETLKPTGSCATQMSPYVLFSVLKSSEEHGAWAARAALDILGGKSPEDIPITENVDASLIVNLSMADALGIIIPLSTLKAATVIGAGNQNPE